MNTLNQALHWRQHGVGCIPVKTLSKKSAIAWREYQDRQPTETELAKWFGQEGGNIGILTGKVSSGLVVLDFDHVAHYHAWRIKHPHYANTYTVKTARGYHTYFFVECLPQQTTAGAWGECKVTGYVLGVGSVHPNGHVYTDNAGEVQKVTSLVGVLPVSVAGDTPAPPRSIVGNVTSITINNYGNGDVTVTTPLYSMGGVGVSPTFVTKSLAQTVASRYSIVDLASRFTELHSSGQGWLMGLCPAHNDHDPSFRIDLRHNCAYCWSPTCVLHDDKGVNVIDFYKRMTGVTYQQAVQDLGRELGLI
jgi:hypothetical protein